MNAASEAFGRNDATALESIFAEDYTFVNPSGAILTRAQRLVDLQSGNMKYDSFTLDQMRKHGRWQMVAQHSTRIAS